MRALAYTAPFTILPSTPHVLYVCELAWLAARMHVWCTCQINIRERMKNTCLVCRSHSRTCSRAFEFVWSTKCLAARYKNERNSVAHKCNLSGCNLRNLKICRCWKRSIQSFKRFPSFSLCFHFSFIFFDSTSANFLVFVGCEWKLKVNNPKERFCDESMKTGVGSSIEFGWRWGICSTICSIRVSNGSFRIPVK